MNHAEAEATAAEYRAWCASMPPRVRRDLAVFCRLFSRTADSDPNRLLIAEGRREVGWRIFRIGRVALDDLEIHDLPVSVGQQEPETDNDERSSW